MERLVGVCSSAAKRGSRWLLEWIPTLANIGAVVTFVLLLVGYCTLQPTLVKLRPEAAPHLSGLSAYENVTYANGSAEELRSIHGPAVWLEGYVTNDGTALASGLALEVALQEGSEEYYGQSVPPVTYLLLGAVTSPSAQLPDVADALPWDNWQTRRPFSLAHIDTWARLYLPPIPPGTYVQIFVGLPIDAVLALSFSTVTEAIAGEMSVRLVQMAEPTKARSQYGRVVPGRPDVLETLALPIKDAYLDWHGVE